MKLFLRILGLCLLMSAVQPAHVFGKDEIYPVSCPDTLKIMSTFKAGEIDEALKILRDFQNRTSISPRPCALFQLKLLGILHYSRDPVSAKEYWRAMLALEPRMEIFDLGLINYRVQNVFDSLKGEMVRAGHIPQGFAPDYIPSAFARRLDSSALSNYPAGAAEAWRRFYHAERIHAYAEDFDYSKTKVKDSLAHWKRTRIFVDPAFLLLEAELLMRDKSARPPSYEIAGHIRFGMEENYRRPPLLLAEEVVSEWGKRLKQRLNGGR